MAGSTSSDQIFIRRLTAIVLNNLENETFGVKDLVHEAGMSLYSLSKRLNTINKKTINQFIREVRLRKALEMLKTGSLTANEIAYKVGFSSPAYFNTCFHEFFGYPPGQVKKGGLKKGGLKEPEDSILIEVSAKSENRRNVKRPLILTISVLTIILVLTLINIYPGHLINFRPNSYKNLKSSRGRISVVVVPFQNLSNDSTLNYLKEWFRESTTSYLSNYSEDLEVRQTESIYRMINNQGLASNASITPYVASLISQKLNANILISGNLIRTSTGIIVNTNIINSKTEEVLKSFREEGTEDEIIQKIDTLSQKIKDYLIISLLKRKLSPDLQHYASISSCDALRHYIQGRDAFRNMDYSTADEELLKAVRIDSNFTSAYILLIISFARNGFGDDSSVMYCRRIYEKRNHMTPIEKLRTEFVYSMFLKTPYDCINYDRQLLELDDQQPGVYFTLGFYYWSVGQQDKAIHGYEQSLEIYKKWGIKPESAENYTYLGNAYHARKQYIKEVKLYRKAEQDFPDDLRIIDNEFKLSLAFKDTLTANDRLKKFITLSKENSISDFSITIDIASMYEFENYQDKAEEYIQKALTLPPDNLSTLTNFAWYLIDKDRDINGGLQLVDKALEIKPDQFNNLDSKGWGLFKLGKYKEALDFLQKADSLNPNKNDHVIDLHIAAAKKAITNKENKGSLIKNN